MRVLFDPEFDLGAWPGPRGGCEAAVGAVWVGIEGFLSTLEIHLGLTAPHAAMADRAAALVPRLFRADRFYGASARADPWATAHRLLAWRDYLWEHGWRGEQLGERRLGELAEVTLGLPIGGPERLEIVAGWLASRAVDVEEVGLLAPRATLSPAWRSVLGGLERGGTVIAEQALPDSVATGNLLAARQSGDVRPGDRSLQVFRPHGPREAARAVAAALAADRGWGETLFVSPDGVLDEALAAFGLPTLGGRSTYGVGGLAELLPMTLRLAWSPMDPQVALDWLTLPDLPIDRSLARQLASTLESWPAVGNPAWQAVVATASSTAADGRSPDVETLALVFSPLAERDGDVRLRDLIPRIDLLDRWASSRAVARPGQGYEIVIAQARAFLRRFALAEVTRLAPPRLDAVLQSIASESDAPRRPALAGYTSVGRPGGMAGPAARVIWWQFLDTESLRRFARDVAGIRAERAGQRWRSSSAALGRDPGCSLARAAAPSPGRADTDSRRAAPRRIG